MPDRRPLHAGWGRTDTQREGAAGALALCTLTDPPCAARDQFDDAEAETDAGGRAGQSLIDAIEAAEDPPLFARRDPDAVVLDVEGDRRRAILAARTTIRFSSGVYFSALSSRLMSAVTSRPRRPDRRQVGGTSTAARSPRDTLADRGHRGIDDLRTA